MSSDGHGALQAMPCYVLGAPPIVASGSRSIVYLCDCRYMTGTPGICMIIHSVILRKETAPNDVDT